MLFIYWFEDHPRFSPRVKQIKDAMSQRGDTLCSSSFVLGELLVGHIKTGDFASADSIEQFFLSSSVSLQTFSHSAARTFAKLRVEGVKPLDALHLAVAATAGVDLFLTNDRRLHRLAIPGISFIATLDTELF